MTSSDRRSERAWRQRGLIAADTVPERIVARRDGAGWLFGWRGGPALEERRAVILRIDRTGAAEPTYDAPGWIRAGSVTDGVAFAVLGRPGPTFTLLRSTDGNHWEDLGRIPLDSVTDVLALRPDEAWMLGAGGIARWAGGFFPVDLPTPGDPTRERLARVADQVVLTAPGGVWIAREHGKRWGHRGVEGAHVRSIAFPYVAALRADEIWVGRLDGAFVDWLGHVEGAGDPAQLGWDEEGGAPRMQLLIVPRVPGQHPGLVLAASHPDGGFATSLVRVPPNEAWMGIAAGKGALAVAADRRLLQSGPI